jgi:hypothetical protein
MVEIQVPSREQRVQHEESVMQQYALRWAVLAAWRDALAQRQVPVDGAADVALTKARIKLASGCFSTCEIGCDLAPAEASMISADASGRDPSVDFWLGLLGHAMSGEGEKLLKIPAVKYRFADCGVPGCRCESG